MLKELLGLVVVLAIGYAVLQSATITGLSVFSEVPKQPVEKIVFSNDALTACCVVDDTTNPPRYCRVKEGYDCSFCESYCLT